MKKSLITKAVKFMQNQNNEHLCYNAIPAQYTGSSSYAGGGAKI
ncbi:MAG: hypothetical protein ACLSWI_01220 [Candidatus Gastranaerophilaceae bacterium]